MTLNEAVIGSEYVIKRIESEDEELNAFLFSLGCYSGESITVVSRKRSGCVVSIKDGRYSIDSQLAGAIIVWAGWEKNNQRIVFFAKELAFANW